jgi:hypothetical protein
MAEGERGIIAADGMLGGKGIASTLLRSHNAQGRGSPSGHHRAGEGHGMMVLNENAGRRWLTGVKPGTDGEVADRHLGQRNRPSRNTVRPIQTSVQTPSVASDSTTCRTWFGVCLTAITAFLQQGQNCGANATPMAVSLPPDRRGTNNTTRIGAADHST